MRSRRPRLASLMVALTLGTSAGLALSVSPGAVAAPGDITLFRSPSGNVNCAYFEADGDVFPVAQVTCEVLRFVGTAPRRPASCELDWVPSATLTADTRAVRLFSCQGDTVAGGPGTPVLAYGRSASFGPFRCSSSTSGIRCELPRSGRGFEVGSRAIRRF